MTKTAWVCAAFGLAICAGGAAAIVYDVGRVQTNKETISRATINLARREPIVAALPIGAALFCLGSLTGHLLFPQYVEV